MKCLMCVYETRHPFLCVGMDAYFCVDTALVGPIGRLFVGDYALLEVDDLGEVQATIRQILVITDGCSNIGEDPIEAATKAQRQGIVVNVIGVIDRGTLGKQGHSEAVSIADAGGGMCRIVHPTELSATAQMMTHQTMQMALAKVVNQELMQSLGKTTDELPPGERARVMQVVDKLEEEIALELVVAIDTSASMKDKLPMVREAVADLSLSLTARSGIANVAVLMFPGTGDRVTTLVQPFQPNVDVKAMERLLAAKGGTPTGPAILAAIDMFMEEDGPRRQVDEDAMYS